MESELFSPHGYNRLPPAEIPGSSRYDDESFSVSLSSDTRYDRRLFRSKSLSSITQGTYPPGEIRRIKERLLRTNAFVVPSAIRKFSRTQKMTLVSLALVDFMSFCSMSIMAPFFPREAAEKGLSDTLSGFVFSFYALVMFITSPIFGKILPRVGAKFLFLSGLFIAGACNLLFGMLEFIKDYTLFTCYCLLIRGLEALGASAFSTASYVFVVNSFPNNIGSVLGILETFVGLGMSTGPAIGGLLYSLGGFEMPFFVLGAAIILIIPINMCLLPVVDDCSYTNKNSSMLKLIKVPAVLVIGLVVIVVSSTWSFLDPTLEPHLRQFHLTPEKIGLIFLLFSALYGISSPIWGWLADKFHNHWLMMVCGLILCTIGLLLLGPCPYITFLESSLWLNLVSLSILGVSVALALLPTFQGVLKSAIEGGCVDSLATYSVVAGIWSCMYSLGEVIGPSVGGILLQHYGFQIASTVMASMTFSLAILTLLYYLLKSKPCSQINDGSDSGITSSGSFYESDESTERTPLLHSQLDPDYRHYTEDKVQYYERSRKLDNENGESSCNQATDIRGTINITAKGACEV